MPVNNPSHPGRLVKADIDELGLSIAEAAEGLGISRQQLYRVVNGQHGVTPEMAVRLEQALGGSADTWLRMQINYDLAQVRGRGSFSLQRLEPKVRSVVELWSE
ncbi:MAG TPA: HigA family addiction module antitoxin [Methylobacterium sp.]|jgi:addiction module HigA family antidote